MVRLPQFTALQPSGSVQLTILLSRLHPAATPVNPHSTSHSHTVTAVVEPDTTSSHPTIPLHRIPPHTGPVPGARRHSTGST